MARASFLKATLLLLGLGLHPASRAADPAPGTAFVLSAPSGTGKSTVARMLVRQVPGLTFAVSHTTRAPRPGERDGVDYFFVDDARFDAMLAGGEFLEWVTIYGRRYGLSRDWVRANLRSGRDLLLDLDSSGARIVRRALPRAVTVFLMPPSAHELARRLRGRGSENGRQVAQRLGLARHECARYLEYDFLVVNDAVDQACRELEAIILADRARRERRRAMAERILAGF